MSEALSLSAADPVGLAQPVEAGSCAAERGPDALSGAANGLSTDYLNHYSEALMLIEMAASDGDIPAELSTWQPIGYRAYFEVSPLRWAPGAIAAYDALAEWHRAGFEQIVQAMDKLVLAAVLALQHPYHAQTVGLVREVISPAIRRLMDRAASFLNSNGLSAAPDTEQEAQAIVDRLIDRS